ncbi:MAG: hypothetical protein ACMG57_04550 [Candidatus Dojkabacteria bacterium]
MKNLVSKKILIVLIILGIIAAIVIGVLTNIISIHRSSISINPPGISDLFACGDYCPGDESQYIVKVYTGVKTQEDCDKHNGEFEYFIGWGTTYYCRVK